MGELRYDIISSLFATAFSEENQCWIVCCESHCFSVCVCLCLLQSGIDLSSPFLCQPTTTTTAAVASQWNN